MQGKKIILERFHLYCHWMKLMLAEWLTWKHKKQKHLNVPITSIRSGMALSSKQQLLVLVKWLCNALSLSFLLLNLLACDSSKQLILLQIEASMATHCPSWLKLSMFMEAWLQPQTRAFEWNCDTVFILSCLPVLEYMFWWAGETPFPDDTIQFRDSFGLCMSSIQQKDFEKQ